MIEGGSPYRAVQAVSAGRLELTEKRSQAPGPGKVRVRVEACGVCHSDAGTVEGQFPVGARASQATRSSGGPTR